MSFRFLGILLRASLFLLLSLFGVLSMPNKGFPRIGDELCQSCRSRCYWNICHYQCEPLLESNVKVGTAGDLPWGWLVFYWWWVLQFLQRCHACHLPHQDIQPFVFPLLGLLQYHLLLFNHQQLSKHLPTS